MNHEASKKQPSSIQSNQSIANCFVYNHLVKCQSVSGKNNIKIKDLNSAPARFESTIDISSIGSPNRSRDSGFFQEGTTENLTSSFTFEFPSSKNRSNKSSIDMRSKTLEVIPRTGSRCDSWLDFEKLKSMGNFEKYSLECQSLNGRINEVNRCIISVTKVNTGTASVSGVHENCSHAKNCKVPDPNPSFHPLDISTCDDTNEHSSDANLQRETLDFHGPPGRNRAPIRYYKDPTATVRNDPCNTHKSFSPIRNQTNLVTPNAADEHHPRNKLNNSSGGNELGNFRGTNRSVTSNQNLEIGAGSCNYSNDSMDFSADGLFDIFGSRLSDFCRQLLSEFPPNVDKNVNSADSSETDVIENLKNPLSESESGVSIDAMNSAEIGGKSPPVTAASKRNIKNQRNKEQGTFSQLVSANEDKSTALEFSLKVDKEPVWNMIPPEPPLNELNIESVPFYCKFSRRSSGNEFNHTNSSEAADSTPMIIEKHEDRITKINFNNSEAKGCLDGKEQSPLKTCVEPTNKLSEDNSTDERKHDDVMRERKQSTKQEARYRNYSAKTLKSRKRFSRSSKEKNTTRRRRREYLHVVGLEIFKTIEEKLRISHKWSGVSPSEIASRRFEQILHNHQENRFHFRLDDPLNPKATNQIREYFSRQYSRNQFCNHHPPATNKIFHKEDLDFNPGNPLVPLFGRDETKSFGSEGHENFSDHSLAAVSRMSIKIPHLNAANNFVRRPATYRQNSSSEMDSTNCYGNKYFNRLKRFPLDKSNTHAPDLKSKAFKKVRNIMQAKIPLNDKVLEIVLNVSERDTNCTTEFPLEEGEFYSCSKIEHDGKTISNCTEDERDEKILNKEVVIVDLDKDPQAVPIGNDEILIGPENEVPKLSLHLNPLESSPKLSDSGGENTKTLPNCRTYGYNEDALISKEDDPEHKTTWQDAGQPPAEVGGEEHNFTGPVLPVLLEVAQMKNPRLSKSFHLLNLENKLKISPKRRIKIISSSFSGAGDAVHVQSCLPVDDKRQAEFEENGSIFMDQETLNVETNINANNSRISKQGISSSDDVIFTSGQTSEGRTCHNSKRRKRVTFNQDTRLNDLTGIRKIISDKIIAMNRSDDSPFNIAEGPEGKQDKEQELDVSEPKQVILINKFLNFSESAVREANLVRTQIVPDVSMGDVSRRLSEETKSGPIRPQNQESKSTNSMETDTKAETTNSEKSKSRSINEEPRRLPMLNGEPSPSGSKFLRKMDAVMVTDFRAAKAILRKAFKDNKFGRSKAIDLRLVKSIGSQVMSRKKRKKANKVCSECDSKPLGKEKILKSIEIQTEVVGDEKKQILGISGSGMSWFSEGSFSFCVRLGLMLFFIVLAVVFFHLAPFQSEGSTSVFNERSNPLSTGLSVE